MITGFTKKVHSTEDSSTTRWVADESPSIALILYIVWVLDNMCVFVYLRNAKEGHPGLENSVSLRT